MKSMVDAVHSNNFEKIAIVGCGTSLKYKNLGRDIESHDLVIRANRAYITSQIEPDWGIRTDLLIVGNPLPIISKLPDPIPFPILIVPDIWREYKDLWPHDRKPLAGTFAAMHACRLGAKLITLYGIDLYSDRVKIGKRIYGKTIFKDHPALPPKNWDLNLDYEAILNLPCKVNWVNKPPRPTGLAP